MYDKKNSHSINLKRERIVIQKVGSLMNHINKIIFVCIGSKRCEIFSQLRLFSVKSVVFSFEKSWPPIKQVFKATPADTAHHNTIGHWDVCV